MIRRHFRTAIRIALWLVTVVAVSAVDDSARQPRIASLPDWFTLSTEFDLAAESRRPLTTEDAHHELSYYVFDQQTQVADQATTTYYAYRITSDAGLSAGAQLSQYFDPSYARLELHFIRIWRDGAAQDRLNLSEIKVIQQERDLERQMFNGELSAITTLADVRKGDIVECAFTVRGMNPVFEGKFIDSTSIAWRSPVAFERIRIIMPAERPLHWRVVGQAKLEHHLTASTTGIADHTWTSRNVAPVNAEDDAPSWHVQYPYLAVSEFADWEAVRAWALPLYTQFPDAPELREKALALAASAATPEQKVLAILDFVQREVRYLGVELGANTHRPHPPAQVLRQRFGDCKDKVTLFCALLREAGIAAAPTLVNTYRLHTTTESLPSPYAFNHVIARVVLGEQTYWLDPTSLHDRGNLLQRDAETDTAGLVVHPAAAVGLQRIPARAEARRRVEVTQDFSYEDAEKPAQLDIIYRYFGASAYSTRAYLAGRTKDEVTREYLDRQKRGFPSLTLSSPVVWRDDAERNIVEIELHCTVPDLWQLTADKSARTAEFYPWDLNNRIVQPDSLTRSAPLELDHPVDITVRTNVHLRGSWQLNGDDQTIETPWYRFHVESHYADQVFRALYTWRSRADHVLAADLPKHVAELARIRKEVGYTLRHGEAAAATPAASVPAPSDGFELNWRSVLLVVVLLIAWTKFAFWLDRLPTDQPPPLVDSHLRGIGGWLILPAISLVIRPFTLLYTFGSTANAYFNAQVWDTFSSPGSPTYQPGTITLLVFELAGNVSVLALGVIAAVFFFRTKRQAPKLVIALLLAMVALHAIDALGGWLIGNTKDPSAIGTYMEAIRASLQALLWVPYFLVSRRVKATFVN